MDLGIKIGVAASTVMIVLGCVTFVAWRTVRREQAELQQKLNLAEQQVRDANARQEIRKTELDKTLAQLEAQKRKVQTPKQVVEALPEVLPLPKTIQLPSVSAATSVEPENTEQPGAAEPAKPDSPQPSVALPIDDLKPLYDFAVGCKACQARLSTVQNDLKDEQVKTAALSRERDSALQAARGGSVMKRIVRAAKWFAIGAAAGAVAVKLAH